MTKSGHEKSDNIQEFQENIYFAYIYGFHVVKGTLQALISCSVNVIGYKISAMNRMKSLATKGQNTICQNFYFHILSSKIKNITTECSGNQRK